MGSMNRNRTIGFALALLQGWPSDNALAGLYGGMLVMCLFGLKEWVEAERRGA